MFETDFDEVMVPSNKGKKVIFAINQPKRPVKDMPSAEYFKGKVELLGKSTINIRIPYDRGLIREIKALPAREWVQASESWTVPIHYLDDVLEFAKKNGIAVDPKLTGDEEVEESQIDKSGRSKTDKIISVPGGDLYEYQSVCVDYFLNNTNGNLLIADDMGCIDGDATVTVRDVSGTRDLKLSDLYVKKALLGPEGTEVLCLKRGSGEIGFHAIQRVLFKYEKPTCSIITSSGKCVRATYDHPFLVKEKGKSGWASLSSIRLGNTIAVRGDSEHVEYEKVVGIKYAGMREVYDIVMEDPHRNFVANGIVVHNCGKTLESMTCLYKTNAFPAMVLCPSSLKINWKREVKKWFGQKVYIIEDLRTIPEGYDYYIISYGMLSTVKMIKASGGKKVVELASLGRLWERVSANFFKSIIIDESHNLANRKSKRTMAMLALKRYFGIRILCTGTPILNRTSEIAAQLDILGYLQRFGGYWAFFRRFCLGYKGKWGWIEQLTPKSERQKEELRRRAVELQNILRQMCMIRREKKDVLSELPDKVIMEQYLEIDNRSKYNKAEEGFEVFLEKKRGDEARALGDDPSFLEEVQLLKQVASEGKFKAVVKWVESVIETEGSILLFCTYRNTLERLQAHFGTNAVSFTGADTAAHRQKMIDRFQNAKGESKPQVIILPIRAGGVGFTLTRTHTVAFVELDWNRGIHTQAEDRAHRIGQKSEVNIYYLLAEETIESRIKEIIDDKGELSLSITDMKRLVNRKK